MTGIPLDRVPEQRRDATATLEACGPMECAEDFDASPKSGAPLPTRRES